MFEKCPGGRFYESLFDFDLGSKIIKVTHKKSLLNIFLSFAKKDILEFDFERFVG